MQTYSQFNQGNNIMPLLMNFTTPSQIKVAIFLPPMGYNDQTQISYEMRLLATRCAKMRPRTGGVGGKYQDMKNENDDTKNVR